MFFKYKDCDSIITSLSIVVNDKWSYKKFLKYVMLFFGLTFSMTYTYGQDLPQNNATEPDDTIYQIKSMDARSAYKLLAAKEEKTIDLSARVQGELENITLSGTFKDKLDMLARLSNSDWFLSGEHLFVTSATERLSRIIALQGVTGEEAKKMVSNAGIDTTRFPLNTAPNGQFILVSAPAKYIAIVETIVEANINAQDDVIITSAENYIEEKNQSLGEPYEVEKEETKTIKMIRYGALSVVKLKDD